MLLYISLFTVLISIVLFFYNWKSNKNTVYLSFVFILTSLFGIGHYFLTVDDSRFWLAVFYNHFAPFMFLIGPFIYFYVRNTLANRCQLTKKDWFHFIPAIIAFIGNLPYLFKSFEKKLQIADQIIENVNAIRGIRVNLFYTIEQGFALRTIFVFLYLIYCFYLLWKFYPSKSNNKQQHKKHYFIIYRWLVLFLINMLFICVCFTILALNAAYSNFKESINQGYILYVIAGFAYSLMSFSLLLFPEILYGIPRKEFSNLPKKKKETIQINLEEDPFFEMSLAIQKYLQEKKPYLKYNFSISTIALDLKIQENHVSYCIKHLMNTNFTKLKTKLRIKNALELLETGSNSLLTIEAIGKKSGFKTRSYFYTAFKKEMGITPSEYLQNFNH